tara:strand:- start:109 stop:1386 length:1278 start_codon:yes stop_codon:yes gene_type:complete
MTWAKTLWPYNRSLTGKGNIKTLNFLNKILKNLRIHSVNSGTKVFDWIIPDQWEINEGYLLGKDGTKICDFKRNNLHVMGYSTSVNKELELNELSKNIYTLKKQPDLIPYVTSYYKKNWGFCMSHNNFKKLKKQKYRAFIDSKHFKGKMHYADIKINGKSKKEIFFSTNICHPSMANNELSGICLLTALAKYLSGFSSLNYTYRFVFIPETIGSINYLSKNFKNLKKNVIAGYTISCVGDEKNYSLIHSPYENNFSEKMLDMILKTKKNYKRFSFLKRGSDERQYCSNLINLPICGFSRTKYEEYPEYHTSGDNFNVMTKKGLGGSFRVFIDLIEGLEESFKKPKTVNPCEPFLSKRDLYMGDISKRIDSSNFFRKKVLKIRSYLDFLIYADGVNDLFDIAKLIDLSFADVLEINQVLKTNNLIN